MALRAFNDDRLGQGVDIHGQIEKVWTLLLIFV